MKTSYHNHTIWSDGQATLAQFIDAARKAGLDELGISDHYVYCPNGETVTWSMPLNFLDEYLAEMKTAVRETTDIAIRIGLEVDYFPETIGEVTDRLSRHPFDYLIGSVHIIDGFPLDSRSAPWEELSQDGRDNMWRMYWQRLREMAERGVFDIVGHLDLPKKYKFLPTADLADEEDATLDAIAASGMAIEFNTAGWNKPIQEAYPSMRLLHEANRRGIPLVINADAHTPGDVADNFDRACMLARDAGYTMLARYAKRQRFMYHMSPVV